MKSIRLAAAAAIAAILPAAGAAAQDLLPDIAPELLNPVVRLEGDLVRFCVYERGATRDFDIAVAQMIGDELLLDVEIERIAPPIAVVGIDTIPIFIEDFYVMLVNDCEAFIGVELVPAGYPDWVTFTQPYIEIPYVAVARTGTHASITDVAAGQSIGTQSLTSADIYLSGYVRSMAESDRWRRLPYPHTGLQLERLVDGTIEVALVWEPWLTETYADLAALDVIDPAPLELPLRQWGIALLTANAYLRDQLDEAIASLLARDAIAPIYAEMFPISAERP